MATRITYRQLTMCPQADGPTDDEVEAAQAEGREPNVPDQSMVIEHVEAGWCQVVNAEFVGGGSDRRFLLHVAVFEPLPDNRE